MVRISYLQRYQTLDPVSVFPGTPPYWTSELSGQVFEAGKTSATGPIAGAVVEILNGPAAGRRATTGVQPTFVPPGYVRFPSIQPGGFRILGVPWATDTGSRIRLRVTKDGYLPLELELESNSNSAYAALEKLK